MISHNWVYSGVGVSSNFFAVLCESHARLAWVFVSNHPRTTLMASPLLHVYSLCGDGMDAITPDCEKWHAIDNSAMQDALLSSSALYLTTALLPRCILHARVILVIFTPLPGGKLSIVISVYVCLSVCLSLHEQPHQNSPTFCHVACSCKPAVC